MSDSNGVQPAIKRFAAQFSHTRKQRYLLQLSEDEFRDRVVRPIFLCQEYSDGRETCGPAEEGVDCYFFQEGVLTGIEITALQTKAGKISKSSNPSDNLHTILAQLRTALDTKIPILLGDRGKRLPLRVFLVASGAILPAARKWISDELDDPRVAFLDAEDLIPLIDDFMPELWLDIESDVLPYLRVLMKELEAPNDLLPGTSTIVPGMVSNAVLDEAFAELHVAPVQTPIANQRRKKKSAPPKIVTFPMTSLLNQAARQIIVFGEGGSGKSTALRRITYELARKPISTANDVNIPVLLRAKDLLNSRTALDAIIDATRSLLKQAASPISSIDLSNGRVTLLIDALDEVVEEDSTNKILDLINDFIDKFPRCQVILTSRNTAHTRNNKRLSAYKVFNVVALGVSQIAKLVSLYNKSNETKIVSSQHILGHLQTMHGLTMSPLIVVLFLATSDSSLRDVPANITELFKKYTELMLGRWDAGKGFNQQIHVRVKEFILASIALNMHRQKKTTISRSDFREQVLSALQSRGLEADAAGLMDEMLVRSSLFRFFDETIEFRHHVFQEYFAGLGIESLDFIKSNVGNDWWKRAIVFYFGAHAGDEDILLEIAVHLRSLCEEDSDALTAATTVGLALQACYLSRLSIKQVVIVDVIFALVRAMNGGNRLMKRLQDTPNFAFLLASLYAHESLALSALPALLDEAIALIDSYSSATDSEKEQAYYWLISGLIEIGEWDLVESSLEKFKPSNTSYLGSLAFNMYFRLARDTSRNKEEGVKILRRYRDRINPTMSKWGADIRKEIASVSKAVPQVQALSE